MGVAYGWGYGASAPQSDPVFAIANAPRRFFHPQKDDLVLAEGRAFEELDIVVTPKYDGGNFTIGPDYFHACST